MYNLHYYASNGGDGSVQIHFMPTYAAAYEADSNLDDGWGESSAGTVGLKVEDGKLYFQKYSYPEGYSWVEVTGQP